MGLNQISSIIVTGGGSVNKEILQIIADIFEMPVVPSSIINSAASGAAIRALNAHYKLCDIIPPALPSTASTIIKPIEENFPIYRRLLERYSRLENEAVRIINQRLKN